MKKLFICDRHAELSFYFNGKKYKFHDHKFITKDKALIIKLNSMNDVRYEGELDELEEPPKEEDNLIKVIRAIAREEIAAAFDDGYDEAEDDVDELVEEKEVEVDDKEEAADAETTEDEADADEEDPFE